MPHQLENNGENGGRRTWKEKWPGEPLFVLLFGSSGGDDASALSQPVNSELRIQDRRVGSEALTASEKNERSRAVKPVRGREMLPAALHLIGWLTRHVKS